jgi:hypothetical protein
MLRKFVVTTCVVFAALLAAQPVMAGSWGPVSSTYKNIVRVKAEGSFSKSGGSTGAQSYFVLTDPVKDGNNVYGKVQTQFYVIGCTTAGASWCTENWKNTKEYSRSNTTTTWKTHLTQTNFRRDASQVRAIHIACAQMGFPVPDSCSDGAYVTITY